MDYLEIYKKFKDVKEVNDYLDDVKKLRFYFETKSYNQMLNHINTIKIKYFVEVVSWNSVNTVQPQSYEQAYINAENFLCYQGAIIILKKVNNYINRLSQDECKFIDSIVVKIS